MKVDLTEEEFKLISRNRENKKKIEDEWKPVLTGELKHDLYSFYISSDFYHESYFSWVTLEQKESLIKDIFSLSAEKGTKFECFIQKGEKCWFDVENLGFEELPDEWANEHLTNIKKVEC